MGVFGGKNKVLEREPAGKIPKNSCFCGGTREENGVEKHVLRGTPRGEVSFHIFHKNIIFTGCSPQGKFMSVICPVIVLLIAV